MAGSVDRRTFLGTVASAGVAAGPLGRVFGEGDGGRIPGAGEVGPAGVGGGGDGAPAERILLRPFDYRGVRLRGGRWARQHDTARDYYLGVSDDDILHGFRRAAGLRAPGEPLGGWASQDSGVVFGQWLQAMARTSRANGDDELRDKAVRLVEGWARTIGADGDPRMSRHYPWEKLVGGLSDMQRYAGHDESGALLDRVVDWGVTHLDRSNVPAAPHPWELHSGRVLEWYTLSENLYRAYQATGKGAYKEFGDAWRYDAYWNRFADTADPSDAHGVHAYSHCNSFSGAAMAYLIDGDPRLLGILRNFYDFLQETQTYATGGYGPAERYVFHDGALGDSLAVRIDSFEAPCCSWAGLKLSKYLTMLTGESRYGDWAERLVYNGVGAALPIKDRGRHFYYANYHLGAALKVYARSTYTCCSGTYFQGVSEYQDMVFFQGDDGLYVNLFLPSEATWERAGGPVRVTLDTAYPEDETVSLRVALARPDRFALALRVPAWAEGVRLAVNGVPVTGEIRPGTWAKVAREWADGDRLDMKVPLTFRRAPIDRWHPERAAVVRGPVVYPQEIVHKHLVRLPRTDAELNDWLLPTDNPTRFAFRGQVEASQRDDFRPFYEFGEADPYRMYFDPSLRTDLW